VFRQLSQSGLNHLFQSRLSQLHLPLVLLFESSLKKRLYVRLYFLQKFTVLNGRIPSCRNVIAQAIGIHFPVEFAQQPGWKIISLIKTKEARFSNGLAIHS